MQGRQLARGSALSSCFAKKEEPGQGTDPAPLDRASRCTARQLRVLKHLRQIRAPRTARRSAWVAQEAEGSRLISYFSTLCTEQCQLRIGCGRWSWQARRLEITDRAVVTFSKQKRVNILNRTSEEFKNRAFQ